ncbi:MAG TPA: hypothetical protein PK698_06370 [Bacilli bacterium]|nr:hypothetical protein [Bacilli bacterium]
MGQIIKTGTLQIDSLKNKQVLGTDSDGKIIESSSVFGDVLGPSVSIDNTIPRFDSTTGKILKSSGVSIDDNDNINCKGIFINSDSENSSAMFSYGYGYDPTASEYFNQKFRIDSFLESPFFSAGIARNYLLQTEVFDNASWVKTGTGTVTANAVASPAGVTATYGGDNIPATMTEISQAVKNSTTGYWSAGVWARMQSGTGTIQLQIDSNEPQTGTPMSFNLTTSWKYIALKENITGGTTRTFRILTGGNAISLWGARMNPGESCNAYSARTISALTTATPGIFFNNSIVYAKTFSGALLGNANTSTYSSYGSYFGNTLSNATDNTDKWEYFGNVTISYNSTYSYGSSYNIEINLDEMSKDGSKTAIQLEKAKLILKGSLASYAGSSATFNSSVPSMAIELIGSNLSITKDDIACLVYSTSTATKVIRFYVKLKDDNTHYNITPINRYGASYASAGTISISYCTFTGVASQSVITSLPSPAQGSVVYATDSKTSFRLVPRVLEITSHATPTINTDNYDAVTITAQAVAITSMTTNLSGTPTNFQRLLIRIKDDGTARAITWGTGFEAGRVALPTTTIGGKTLLSEFIYDSVDGKWACESSGSRS